MYNLAVTSFKDNMIHSLFDLSRSNIHVNGQPIDGQPIDCPIRHQLLHGHGQQLRQQAHPGRQRTRPEPAEPELVGGRPDRSAVHDHQVGHPHHNVFLLLTSSAS